MGLFGIDIKGKTFGDCRRLEGEMGLGDAAKLTSACFLRRINPLVGSVLDCLGGMRQGGEFRC